MDIRSAAKARDEKNAGEVVPTSDFHYNPSIERRQGAVLHTTDRGPYAPQLMSKKFCPSCGFENGTDSKFCAQCGASLPDLERVCTNCHSVLAPNAQFCTNCGTRVAAQTQQPQQPVPDARAAEPNIYQELDRMAPGDKTMRYGKEFTMRDDRVLSRTDEKGIESVDAASYFYAMQKERNHESPTTQKSPETVGYTPSEPAPPKEIQPLWDPAEEEQPLWDPTEEDDQPLWDPTEDDSETIPVVPEQPVQINSSPAPEYDDEKDAEAMGPLDYLARMKKNPSPSDPAPLDDNDEDGDDDDDEGEGPLAYLSKLKRNARSAASTDDEHAEDDEEDDDDSTSKKNSEAKRFQKIANSDGYYDDRRPFDEDFYFERKQSVQWVPLVLGLIAIVLGAAAILMLNRML